MSIIIEKFYNFFWQNKACQNLFLLSKEELLDTIRIPLGDTNRSFSLPRVILSNVEKNENLDFETLKIRTENEGIISEEALSSKVEIYTPLLIDFVESNYKKSFEKLIQDIEENPENLLKKLCHLFFKGADGVEPIIIEFLQEYGFIGKHLQSFQDIEFFFEKEFISKKMKSILTESHFLSFLEVFKSIKDIYVNETYKGLYGSNQILVNALYDIDDYESRLHLFSILYESKIISSSKEDAFIECLNCEPGTYKGVFQLKMNPKRLKELKCPVCQRQLTYYVPYELHQEIYEIVKLQDGLLHDALCRWLNYRSINFAANKLYLNDIEIDCVVNMGGIEYIIECKMYKINTTHSRLVQKIKKHYGKLLSDSKRIYENYQINVFPILLVNIPNDALLANIENQLKPEINEEGDFIMKTRIVNINMLNEVLE